MHAVGDHRGQTDAKAGGSFRLLAKAPAQYMTERYVRYEQVTVFAAEVCKCKISVPLTQ